MFKKMNIKLKKIKNNKVTKKWVKWLNDKEVTKYSKNRFMRHTVSSQENYLKKKLRSKNIFLFKILFNNLHIGVIEIGKINGKRSCHISYMIGEKSYWNKGIGSKVIKNIKKIIFNNLKIKRIYAGLNEKNKASFYILKKNDFKIYKKTANSMKFGSKRVAKITLLAKNNQKKL